MSVKSAKKFFVENANQHINAKNDPAAWNLNAGLAELVDQLDRELSTIKAELDDLKRKVR